MHRDSRTGPQTEDHEGQHIPRQLAVTAFAAIAGTALLLTRCGPATGGAPTDLNIAAATDSTVRLTWQAPSGGTPDRYIVYFAEVGTHDTVAVESVLTPEAVHDPAGKTGSYKVVATFGSTEYEALTTPSTTPIHTPLTTVSELNAGGDSSGYGWARADGTGGNYGMSQISSAALVDFYVTDFEPGYAGPDYFVASPNLGPVDGGAVVPPDGWRVNGVAVVTSEQSALPRYDPVPYKSSQKIQSAPPVFAVYSTADDYYGLVKFTDQNVGAGTIKAETWFQLVKGLRLIQH